MGLDKDGWEIVGAIAAILGVVVTAAAVGVSLWLALRTEKYKIKATAGIRLLVTQGSSDHEEYLFFRVVNCGRRIVKITGFGWRMGKRKKVRQHWIQMLRPSPLCADLPKMLDDGEDAVWMVPLKSFLNSKGGFRTLDGKADFDSLRAIVTTSIGVETVFRPEQNLLDRVIEIDKKTI